MEQHIIIVGTTPDYTVRIQREERAEYLTFLLDLKYEGHPGLEASENSCHVFADLGDCSVSLNKLEEYLSSFTCRVCFACFDCEALYLASRLAEHFNCPFPAPSPVLKSRNKFLSGRIWRDRGVNAPGCGLASGLSDSLELFYRYNENAVLKPVTGSGSELVFHCREEAHIREAVETMESQLEKRRDNPLFSLIMDPVSKEMIDPCRSWVVSEFISGTEYSCDFFMDGDSIHIIRETEKIKDSRYPLGTVSGYLIPPSYTGAFTRHDVKTAMKKAADSLGFSRGYFMADFIISGNSISMIEITPRPGGDSLPDLVRAACGHDILSIYLDIMSFKPFLPENLPEPAGNFAGIHFYSDRKGVIADIDTQEIINDHRTRLLLMKKKKGDSVSLPPDDYDNRQFGYCVVSLEGNESPLEICREFQNKINVSFAPEDLNETRIC